MLASMHRLEEAAMGNEAETRVTYSVGEVARLTGVTVRTLHHHDAIGVLRPQGRSEAGYRLYDGSDLERLQQILFYRELDFPLEEIGAILSAPGLDPVDHLRRQHELLTVRIKRLEAMVAAIEYTMEVQRMGISLTPEERFEVFGDWKPEDYAEEAEQRWGGSEAYTQSQKRAADYTKEDWLRIKAEGADLDARFASAVSAGIDPDSEEAMALAEEHRQQITRNFYECSPQMHRGLAEMFVFDPRFRARYEEIAPGLAEFVAGAIRANADRAERSQ
jgi:MerR family transcriptional regulator, thiopeptide resistance regulator